MKIALYGGSFDPPHLGHVRAAAAAVEAIAPARLLLMPNCIAPHKTQGAFSASAEDRLAMTRLAFANVPSAEVSSLELERGGMSYTVDTVRQLLAENPESELYLLVGTDMLETFESWVQFREILDSCTLCAFPRTEEDAAALAAAVKRLESRYDAKILLLPTEPIAVSSTELRALLPLRRGCELLADGVYSYIIQHRLYGAQPDFAWLREKSQVYLKPKRIPHVLGTEEEAARLAKRWGVAEDIAREAGILHDITKKFSLDEQLRLCENYGIIIDDMEKRAEKLLHSKTGAGLSRALFGISDEVYSAIFWHTTGKPAMTMLEKIIYMADYIEPNRDFDGVEELRRLAYENINQAMALGLEMSLEDIQSRGNEPHPRTMAALAYYKKEV